MPNEVHSSGYHFCFCFLASSVLWDSCQFLFGRDHFGIHTVFLWAVGSRFQQQTRVQIPENRSELREKETKGTQRIIFIKIQMKQNKKLNNVKFWNLLPVFHKPTNSQNVVIMNSGHLEENLPLNRIFSSAPLKSLFFLRIFQKKMCTFSYLTIAPFTAIFEFDPSFDHWQTPFKEKDPSLSHEHCWT